MGLSPPPSVSYAWLTLVRAPRFSLGALATLAVGSAAAVIGFVLYHALLIHPLPYAQPDRLVAAWVTDGDNQRRLLSPWLIQRLSESLNGAGEVAAIRSGATARDFTFDLLEPSGYTSVVRGSGVSTNLFDILGVPARLGRTFGAADGLVGAAPVVVLSYDYWIRQFHGDPGIIGRSLRLRSVLHDRVYEVVGVMPRDFRTIYSLPQYAREESVYQEDLWVPVVMDAAEWNNPRRLWGQAFVRLAPGMRPDVAQAIVGRSIPSPGGPGASGPDVGLRLVSLEEDVILPWKPAMTLGLLTTLVVCALAVVNVGTLCLLHFRRRRAEMAVLTMLGATTGDLVARIACALIMLAIGGVVCGLIIAYVSLFGIVAIMSPVVPRVGALFSNASVWMFAGGLTSALAGGLIAIVVVEIIVHELVSLRVNVFSALRSWRKRNHFTHAMLAAQVCLATVLLVGAGLLISSLVRLLSVDVGFATDDLVTAIVELKDERYLDAEERWRFHEALLQRLAARADGGQAATTNSLPYVGVPFEGEFLTVEEPHKPAGTAALRAVSAQYFPALRIPVLEGRTFTLDEIRRGDPVCIVNEEWRRHFSSQRSPIGRKVMFRGRTWRTVIGVVGNVREASPKQAGEPTMYAPFDGQINMPIALIVRTSASLALGRDLPAIVGQIDRTVPVTAVRSMADIVSGATRTSHLYATVLGVMGLLATIMACIGTYALVSEGVGQREAEVAVRMAVGATETSILWLVMRSAALAITSGAVGGLILARVMSFLLDHVLFELRADDPFTHAMTAFIVICAAILGAYGPARSATRSAPGRLLSRSS